MNAEQTARYAADLDEVCNGDYLLNDGTLVRGNALSYVTSHMRDKGWRNLSYYNLTQSFKHLGFQMKRGRGMRVYHGGVMKRGVECDVVFKHVVETAPQ
jgi:hypothetical protein